MKWKVQMDRWKDVLLSKSRASNGNVQLSNEFEQEIHTVFIKFFFRIHLLRVLMEKSLILEKKSNSYRPIVFSTFADSMNKSNSMEIISRWIGTLNSIFSGKEPYRDIHLPPKLIPSRNSPHKLVKMEISPEIQISLLMPKLPIILPKIKPPRDFVAQSSFSEKNLEYFLVWSHSEYDSAYLLKESLEIADIIQLTSTSQKSLGAYYTPHKMVDYLVTRQFYLHLWLYAQDKIENPPDSFKKLLDHPPWSLSTLVEVINNFSLNVPTDMFWMDYLTQLSSMKICDPTCGSGDFLLECFTRWNALVKIISQKIQNSQQMKVFIKKIKGPRLYGYDIDENAIEAMKNRLMVKFVLSLSQENPNGNLFVSGRAGDFLAIAARKIPPKFDFIVGNPPYLNTIEKINLRKQLEQNFPQIYHGKLDYCYYFIIAATKCLSKDGILGFVLKRYFLKSATAERLRKELLKFNLIELFDHGDRLFFKPAGIQTAILILQNSEPPNQIENHTDESSPPFYLKFNESRESRLSIWEFPIVKPINLYKMKNRWLIPSKASWGQLQTIQEGFKTLFDYTIQDFLLINYPSGAIIEKPKADSVSHQNKPRIPSEDALSEKINGISVFKLVKGIQTGKDHIFIVPNSSILNAEKERIKPFIKGKDISPYLINPPKKKVIISHRYSPIIGEKHGTDPKYPIIEQYLSDHKVHLQDRSRAKEADWAFWRKGDERITVDFNYPKIVWPYRGPDFYVAIDNRGNYHSQDVILLTLNIKEMEKKLSISSKYKELLDTVCRDWTNFGIFFYLGLMNSEIFGQHLKYRAKEFAKKVYDFQPNNFHHIQIPLYCRNNPKHQELVKLSQKVDSLFLRGEAKKRITPTLSKINLIAKEILTT